MKTSTKLGLVLVTLLGTAAGGCAGEESDTTASTPWNCHAAKVPHGSTFECTAVVSSAATADGPSYTCAPGDGREECPPADEIESSGATSDDPATSGGVTSDCATTGGDGFFCTFEDGVRTCRKTPTCEAGTHRVQMDCEPDQSSGVGSGASEPTKSGGYPGGGTDEGSMSGETTECFYPVGAPAGTTMPAATFAYVLESIAGATQLHTRLTFSPTFVDNTYGTGSVGWASRVHKFRDLVGSDHAELAFRDKTGAEKLHFKLDYISASASAPSGYASLGVTGGEGRMILGDASSITKASSSLDRNLNERGYKQFLVDSPPTDASFTASAAAPGWDYRVVYEAWIKNEAFGAGGFGKVELAFVHASPSKASSNTLPVVPGPCPANWTNGGVR